jgi:uncharacterized membrane protein
MQVDVVNSVLINRPVAVVSQYAADPDNAPLWYENIKSVEWRTPGPVKVGSQVDFVAQFLGRRDHRSPWRRHTRGRTRMARLA